MLAWPLAAMGGVYRWGAVPAMLGCAVLALVCRPRIAGARETRLVDLAILLFLAGVALQTLPLPGAATAGLSPNAGAVKAAVYLQSPDAASDPALPRSLSVRPAATVESLALVAAVALFFWSCRRAFEQGATRTFGRSLAYLGLGLALLAIVQRATSPDLIYWRWLPLDEGATPFGPFVNRNHLATWLIMALPVVTGHMLAGRGAHAPGQPPVPPRDRLEAAAFRIVLARLADARTLWRLAAALLMTVALVASLSRSGLVSLSLALAAGGWLTRRQLGRRGRLRLAMCGSVLMAAVFAWSNPGAVAARLDRGLAEPTGGRLDIWRDTLVLARDFWLTGSGLGTYETAMLVYRESARPVFYNHAHNQYLQIAAEGGLLLGLPALLAALALARLARRRLRTDTSWVYWVRAGAVAGLIAVAIQSLWEGGLRLPANALLAAALAALATHEPPPAPMRRERVDAERQAPAS